MLVAASALHAEQNPGLPVTDHNGESCYFYTVKSDESVFGILSRFGWDEATFLLYNPEASSLKKGMLVYYPTGATGASAPVETVMPVAEVAVADSVAGASAAPLTPVHTPGVTAEHIIRPGDTLYALAREYNTTVADIFRLNRGLTEESALPGTTVRIQAGRPEDHQRIEAERRSVVTGTHSYKVQEGDTWLSIAEANSLTLTVLRSVNDTDELPRKGKKIQIPEVHDTIINVTHAIIDPRENTPAGRDSIYREVHLTSQAPLELTILQSDAAEGRNRDLEFTRGFLLALDRCRTQGKQVKLHVRRMAPEAITSTSLATDSALAASRMILATYEKDLPAALATFADAGQKDLINVFDAKSELYKTSPSLLQVLTPSTLFYSSCVEFLIANKPDARYIFVAEDEPDGECVSLLLLERLIRESGNYETIPSYADLGEYRFDPSHSYVIVSDLNRRADINKFTGDMADILARNPAAHISVVGRPTWVLYADQFKERLQKLDTYIPSRFYMDPDDSAVQSFEKSYREAFGGAPLKSYPGYAAMGYDMGRYLMENLETNGADLNRAESTTDALQLDMRTERDKPWTGLVNGGVYLLHFTPYNTIDKIRL